MPQVSIIITSHNYACYLKRAIDSALQQPGDVEVVVVEDGSTDASPEILEGYGDRVRAIYQQNGGQAAAMNTGMAACQGEVVLFLDSDDELLPGASTRLTRSFGDRTIGKAHWKMREIDRCGAPTGRLIPDRALSFGDLRSDIIRDGPEAYEWPPTSGNAWRRSAIEAHFPIPPGDFQVCPDVYLAALAPFCGKIARIDEPLSCWRRHDINNSWGERFELRLPRFCRQWDLASDALLRYCQRHEIPANQARWRENAWCHRVLRAVESIRQMVPAGATFLLIDDGKWGSDEQFFGRRCLPFPHRQGKLWGRPIDDADAIRELRRGLDDGARFIVWTSACDWWKDYYRGFLSELQEMSRVVFRNDGIEIFQIGE